MNAMEIFVYRPGAERVLEGFTKDDLPTLLEDKESVIWVDLRGESREEAEEASSVLRDIFHFHPLTVEDSIETRHQPKVEAFETYFYFIVHGIRPGETGPGNFATKELDGYLGDNYVVTYHTERFRSIRDVKAHIRTNPYACRRGAAFLLHQILDRMVDLYMPIVDEFDEVINVLEDRVLEMRHGNGVLLEDVMMLRRSVARLRRISARQLDVFNRISQGEFDQVPQNVLPFFRDVHDHLQRISDVADGYRDLVSGLFDMHFAMLATRTNDVMKTLAVLSAIVLPLSLIAGIYGMNFDHMPELRSANGYFITLAVMALVAVLLLVYFWRRGWIFQGSGRSSLDEESPKE